MIIHRFVKRIETFEEFGQDWGLTNYQSFMEYLEERDFKLDLLPKDDIFSLIIV